MNSIDELLQHSQEIEEKIAYAFKDKSLLAMAFVHCSFVNEDKNVDSSHNERLEFLGDSVLGLLASSYLYTKFPHKAEGDLSHLRSRLVEASSCVQYVQKLELEPYLLLSKGERMNGGRGRDSILADLFEAIIGAIYLDGGLEAAKHFLFTHFETDCEAILDKPLRNWKAELQDYAQKNYQQTPVYTVISATGPDHKRVFEIAVSVNHQELARGYGGSKKEAQQEAAANAVKHALDKTQPPHELPTGS